MDAQFDVAVISAFGRGHFLAASCAQLGLKTALIDVSAQLGRWAPEDAEGPFGIFYSPNWTPLQKARISEEAAIENVPEGFSLWLKNGVIDVFGPQTVTILNNFGVNPDIQTYLSQYNNLSEKDREKQLKSQMNLAFDHVWFLHLAHQLASPVYQPNHLGLLGARPLSLFAPHAIRMASRRGFEKSLEWLESQSVRVFRSAKIKDLSFQANFVQGLEIDSDRSGALVAEQYIWGLSSAETEHLSPSTRQELYPTGVLEPEWYWSRYRFGLKGPIVADLPLHFFMIEDIQLPWTHENLLSVMRTPSEGQFDVWMRLPDVHRFQRQYLVDRGEAVRERLHARLPGVEIQLLDLPQEHRYDPKELGPVRWPVYAEAAWLKLKPRPWINLHLDSPEIWQLLDWTGQFAAQQECLATIADWKKDRDDRRAKLLAEGAKT